MRVVFRNGVSMDLTRLLLDDIAAALEVPRRAGGDPEMLDQARRAVPQAVFLEGDLTDLPADDKRFALVVCGLALAHVTDLDAAVGELARVTRPGGRCVISVLHPFQAVLGWHAPSRTKPARDTSYASTPTRTPTTSPRSAPRICGSSTASSQSSPPRRSRRNARLSQHPRRRARGLRRPARGARLGRREGLTACSDTSRSTSPICRRRRTITTGSCRCSTSSRSSSPTTSSPSCPRQTGTYLFFYPSEEAGGYSRRATGLQHLAFMVPTRGRAPRARARGRARRRGAVRATGVPAVRIAVLRRVLARSVRLHARSRLSSRPRLSGRSVRA